MSHTKTPWFPIAHQDCHVSIMRSHRGGTWTCIEGEHAGDPIVGLTLTDYLHSVHCVNSHDELVRQRDELRAATQSLINALMPLLNRENTFDFVVAGVLRALERCK